MWRGCIVIAAAALLLINAIANALSGQAATVEITGSRFGRDSLGSFPGYGICTSKNNVLSRWRNRSGPSRDTCSA